MPNSCYRGHSMKIGGDETCRRYTALGNAPDSRKDKSHVVDPDWCAATVVGSWNGDQLRRRIDSSSARPCRDRAGYSPHHGPSRRLTLDTR